MVPDDRPEPGGRSALRSLRQADTDRRTVPGLQEPPQRIFAAAYANPQSGEPQPGAAVLALGYILLLGTGLRAKEHDAPSSWGSSTRADDTSLFAIGQRMLDRIQLQIMTTLRAVCQAILEECEKWRQVRSGQGRLALVVAGAENKEVGNDLGNSPTRDSPPESPVRPGGRSGRHPGARRTCGTQAAERS